MKTAEEVLKRYYPDGFNNFEDCEITKACVLMAMKEYGSQCTNDRDFKLLVIEERRLRAINPAIDMEPKLHKRFQEVTRMLENELETFTRKDVEELPFNQ